MEQDFERLKGQVAQLSRKHHLRYDDEEEVAQEAYCYLLKARKKNPEKRFNMEIVALKGFEAWQRSQSKETTFTTWKTKTPRVLTLCKIYCMASSRAGVMGSIYAERKNNTRYSKSEGRIKTRTFSFGGYMGSR